MFSQNIESPCTFLQTFIVKSHSDMKCFNRRKTFALKVVVSIKVEQIMRNNISQKNATLILQKILEGESNT